MTRKKVRRVIAFNGVLIVLALFWYFRTPPLSLSCQGNLTFTDQRTAPTFNVEGGIFLRFHDDGTGYLTLNGDVTRKQQRWQVSRQEMFSWQHMHDSLYEITILKIERFGHDQLPDGIFEKYIEGLTLGQKRLVTVERTPDEATVISNAFSPLLVCAD